MSQPFYRDAHGNLYDERGLLLPFLAGVLVTAPFVFLKNNQPPAQQYPPPAPIYYPMYPQPYPPYPYR